MSARGGHHAASILAIADRVREARLAAGLTQQRLGAALGVSFQQVQKYETGRNRVSADRLLAIAMLTDAPIAWFFATEAVALQPPGEATEG